MQGGSSASTPDTYRSGGSNGIGFAIPASLVNNLAQARAGASSFQRPGGIEGANTHLRYQRYAWLAPYEGILLTELHPQVHFARRVSDW